MVFRGGLKFATVRITGFVPPVRKFCLVFKNTKFFKIDSFMLLAKMGLIGLMEVVTHKVRASFRRAIFSQIDPTQFKALPFSLSPFPIEFGPC